MVIAVLVTADGGPAFVDESTTLLGARRKVSVPSLQLVTVTLKEEPAAADGVKTQPVAVPVLEKSVEASPVIASLKAN